MNPSWTRGTLDLSQHTHLVSGRGRIVSPVSSDAGAGRVGMDAGAGSTVFHAPGDAGVAKEAGVAVF